MQLNTRHPGLEDGPARLRSALEHPADWALFLDIDGTLVDIADGPHAVRVESGLPQQLVQLAGRLDGALALVTGRRVDWIDANFGPHLFPAAGLHGVERRRAAGDLERAAVAPRAGRGAQRSGPPHRADVRRGAGGQGPRRRPAFPSGPPSASRR
ncbi:trehalose-phosphatase [Cereibacter changlensis]|uniref:trehalose-phosphatase n=1 Tax=Cereibacter changlensis TaxID=402884 RepID=UPI0040338C69